MPSPFPLDDFDDDPLWLPYAIVLVSTSPLYVRLISPSISPSSLSRC